MLTILLVHIWQDKLVENAVGSAVLLFVGLTFIFSLINGFGKSFSHLLLGVCLISFTLITVQLIRWYRLGDLDPKFKFLILTMGLSIVLLGIMVNLYIWAPTYPNLDSCYGDIQNIENPHGSLGFYDVTSRKCFLKCQDGFYLDLRGGNAPGECKPIPA
ncbi:hypothetical protein HK102_000752 [Quaeritorhiza haematococci]|nr:hypothetical protein HK102_000752 [Quaeritorhiza haematococci]